MDELEVWTHFLPEEEPVQEGSFLRADRARLTATSQQQSPIVLSSSFHMKKGCSSRANGQWFAVSR